MSAKQYGMAVDTKRCIGCHTCSMACKVENNLPNDVWWNRTVTVGGEDMDSPEGEYPNLKKSYLTMACQHCAEPACVAVCPVQATYKDADTGVVHQDYEKCIGCKTCLSACPYTGVRVFNEEDPVYYLDFAVGNENVPPQQGQTMSKCILCTHRLVDGGTPACVEVCPARARFFGDLNDPNSDVSKKIKERDSKQLLPERGTNPSIYFLS